MSAVLQFEADRKRLMNYGDPLSGYKPHQVLYRLLREAILDTYNNGGTFVLVVTADKITAVQRTEAEHP